MAAFTGQILVEPRWKAGESFSAVGKYSLTGAIASADTVTWPNMFPDGGVQVVDVRLTSVELDTNATPTATATLGTEDSADGLIQSFIPGVNTTGNTQINATANGGLRGTTLTSAKDVILTIGGTVGTAQTSGNIWVIINYYCAGLS